MISYEELEARVLAAMEANSREQILDVILYLKRQNRTNEAAQIKSLTFAFMYGSVTPPRRHRKRF